MRYIFPTILFALLAAALQAQEEAEPQQAVRNGLATEVGVHYGSPLRLSIHLSQILPVTSDGVIVEQDFEVRRKGLEFHGEAGIGGARVGIGWGSRLSYYYNGWSLGVGLIRTWESFYTPLGFRDNQSLISLSGRIVSLGATLRGEFFYNLDDPDDRWGVGWSVGLALW